jgi:hypothetical protein
MAGSGEHGLIKECNRQRITTEAHCLSCWVRCQGLPVFIHAEEQITTVLYQRAIKADDVFYCGVTAGIDQKRKELLLR